MALAPLHIDIDGGKIEAAGDGLTVTFLDADAVHPLEFVTVTE